MKPQLRIVFRWLTIVFAALLGAALIRFPLSYSFVTPSGLLVSGWVSRTICRLYWPLLIALGGVTAFAWRFVSWKGSGLICVFRPILLLPLLFFCGFSAQWIGTGAASLFIPYGGTLVVALMLNACWDLLHAPGDGRIRRLAEKTPRKITRWILPALCLIFIFFMVRDVSKAFVSGGDTTHYRLQIDNLMEKGNLDLTDWVNGYTRKHGITDDPEAVRQLLSRSHIIANAEGRHYSYHSYGFPLLAWPFVHLFRQKGLLLLLILLSFAGITGCFVSCRECGASRASSALCSALLCCSSWWILTSSMTLPEMMGVALTAWAFWSVMAQNRPERRIAATLVSAICCAYLPYTHIRFLPLALMLFGFFGLEGLLIDGEDFWRRKAWRLGLFAAACLAAWGFLLHTHHVMFYSGENAEGAYNYGGVLLSRPLAMWGMFADRRGLTSLLPSVWFMAVAPFATLWLGGRQMRWASFAILAVLAVLLCCCSNEAALAGACLNGRYFSQTVPILLPFAALQFDKMSRTGRIWYLFLSLTSVLFMAYILLFFGKERAIRSPYQIWQGKTFANLMTPLVSCFWTADMTARVAGFAFAAGMILTSLALICSCARKSLRWVSAAILAITLAAGLVADNRAGEEIRTNAAWLFAAGNTCSYFHCGQPVTGDYFANLSACEKPLENTPFMVLTDDEAHNGKCVVFGKSCRRTLSFYGNTWYHVRIPEVKFQARMAGVMRISGKVMRGSAQVALYRHELSGDKTVLERLPLQDGEFRHVFYIPEYDERAFYAILLSLDDGHGEVVIDNFDFAPYVAGLESVIGPL